MLGMGISNLDYVVDDVVGAFVPCDYCVNAILLATTVSAYMPKPDFSIYNVSSTTSGLSQKEFFAKGFTYLNY